MAKTAERFFEKVTVSQLKEYLTSNLVATY
jgi:hypothetical protein